MTEFELFQVVCFAFSSPIAVEQGCGAEKLGGIAAAVGQLLVEEDDLELGPGTRSSEDHVLYSARASSVSSPRFSEYGTATATVFS